MPDLRWKDEGAECAGPEERLGERVKENGGPDPEASVSASELGTGLNGLASIRWQDGLADMGWPVFGSEGACWYSQMPSRHPLHSYHTTCGL